jgi:hypothetical protein
MTGQLVDTASQEGDPGTVHPSILHAYGTLTIAAHQYDRPGNNKLGYEGEQTGTACSGCFNHHATS